MIGRWRYSTASGRRREGSSPIALALEALAAELETAGHITSAGKRYAAAAIARMVEG